MIEDNPMSSPKPPLWGDEYDRNGLRSSPSRSGRPIPVCSDQNGSREAHIHDTPREPSAHHARLQFTDARCADAAENPGPGIVNTARLRYRVGSGGRIGVGLEQPRVFNPPGFKQPKGWTYPFSCCSGYDCRQVPASAIIEGPNGYTIKATGEVIPMTDPKVKMSPDGEFHWCSQQGRDDGKTICLFTPGRGS